MDPSDVAVATKLFLAKFRRIEMHIRLVHLDHLYNLLPSVLKVASLIADKTLHF